MNRTQHPSNNAVLGAPNGWDQTQLPCDALPITRDVVDGRPAIASFWTPTRDELARLNAGRPVVLWILGDTMPPVSVGVDYGAAGEGEVT